MLSFRNQVVLITGASRGVGAATAVNFAEASAAGVVINYRANRDAALIVPQSSRARMRECLACAGRSSRAEQAQALIKQTVDRFGGFDVVVVNAGV